jgi:polar amino acid transport system permease protein
MDFSVVADNLGYLLRGRAPAGPLGGAALTLLLSLASGMASAVLGLAGGVALSWPASPHARLWPWVRRLLLGWIALLRSMPVLLLIFWIYFLLPLAFGLAVPGFGTVVVALSLVGGAYLAQSVHAGILSLPPGQLQAALALGLPRREALWRVILPQALPAMMPSFINQWVALTKDTSLAYVIGVGELTFLATQVNNRTMVHAAEIFLFVALVYFVFCTALELAAGLLARRMTA